MKKLTIKKLGECGVDSGQLFLIDPCYLAHYKDNEFDAGVESKNELSYSAVCERTIKDFGGKVGGRGGGVAFRTGFGDGVYDVYAIISDEGDLGKRVAGVFIDCGLINFNLNNLL